MNKATCKSVVYAKSDLALGEPLCFKGGLKIIIRAEIVNNYVISVGLITSWVKACSFYLGFCSPHLLSCQYSVFYQL